MHEHLIQEMARTVQQRLADKNIRVETNDIVEPLRAYWADYAAHIWHTEDVFFQADQMALPMSQKAAREILRLIEDKIDSEYGITWNTIDTVIHIWIADVDWFDLSDDELAEYSGNFVLSWKVHRGAGDCCRVVRSGNLLDAVHLARKTALEQSTDVRLMSTDASILENVPDIGDEDDDFIGVPALESPKNAAEFGSELIMIQTPDALRPLPTARLRRGRRNNYDPPKHTNARPLST